MTLNPQILRRRPQLAAVEVLTNVLETTLVALCAAHPTARLRPDVFGAVSTVLPGVVVCTLTLFCFVTAVLSGLTRRAAWLSEVGGALSLSSGYRLWRRLREAQAMLRGRLCRVAPPPDSAAREPLGQLLAHVVPWMARTAGLFRCGSFRA